MKIKKILFEVVSESFLHVCFRIVIKVRKFLKILKSSTLFFARTTRIKRMIKTMLLFSLILLSCCSAKKDSLANINIQFLISSPGNKRKRFNFSGCAHNGESECSLKRKNHNLISLCVWEKVLKIRNYVSHNDEKLKSQKENFRELREAFQCRPSQMLVRDSRHESFHASALFSSCLVPSQSHTKSSFVVNCFKKLS